MEQTHRSAFINQNHRRGFALVLALSLMAFLLLLILTLSKLTLVKTSVETAAYEKARAQQNALFALQEALGELQLHAGPDQRVTTRGDIWAPLGEVSGATIEFGEVENPFYTLVWDVSGAENQSPGDVPGHNSALKPAVLVSGNRHTGFDFSKDTSYPATYTTPMASLGANDDSVVTLLNGNGDSPYQVRVPKVKLGDDQSYYAWWIGDENTKARLNLNESLSASSNVSAWLSPRRYGVQLNPFLENAEHLGLAKSLDYDNLYLLDGVSTLQNEDSDLRADFSMYSRSLLTDVRNGGLKKDLTYGLDAKNTPPPQIADDVFLFDRSLGGARANMYYNLNFAQWGVLRDYYNYRPVGDSIEARAHRVPSTPRDAAYTMGLHPIITRFQLGLYGDYAGDDGNEIRFRYMPVMVLWNPYPFKLKFPELHTLVRVERTSQELIIDNIKVKGDKEIENERFSVAKHGVLPFSIPGGEIEPGKAVIYSPKEDMALLSPARNYFGDYEDRSAPNWLEPGYRPGAAFYELSGIKKTEPGNPELQFAIQFTTGAAETKRIYLNLSERNPVGRSDRSVNKEYQLITGFLVRDSLSDFYTPLPKGDPEPRDPTFSFICAMPFAETDLFDTASPPRMWMGQYNPRARVNIANRASPLGYEGVANYVGGFQHNPDHHLQIADSKHTYVGNTLGPPGSDQAVLFDIPTEPLQSIARLGHANLLASPAYTEKHTSGITDQKDRYDGTALQLLRLSYSSAGDDFSPAYSIGNARANPYIPLKNTPSRFWKGFDEYTNANSTDSRLVWDFPYLLNEVLFDQYFFSTIPQSGSSPTDFSNPLIKLEDPSIAADVNRLRSFDKAAGELLFEGGFNVNSTSVEAWSAFLAAMRDEPYDEKNGQGSLFARFIKPQGDKVTDENLSAHEAESITGFRRLSDDQIEDLAERIVEQVKLRGPFPSMAAFVNRVMWEQALYRDDSDYEKAAPDPYNIYSGRYNMEEMVMRKGALVAALELADANKPFYDSSELVDSSTPLVGNSSETRGFLGAVGAGIPGYLSQMDILSLLGPAMTVRSDTFKIRAYGAHTHPLNGQTISEAWCEAVVQRTPDYVNSNENDRAETALNNLSNTNRDFGRRFRIVSFRWLSPDEI